MAGFLFAGLIGLLPAAPARAATIAYVTIKDFGFTPATVIIKPGWEVRWTNTGKATHTVDTDAGAPAEFSSPQIAPSDSYQRPLSVVGTYRYHCNIHSGMSGTIIVRTNNVPPPPSPAAPSPAASPTATATKSPTPKSTPRRSASPTAAKRTASPTPKAVVTRSPSASPSPTLAAAGDTKDGGGTGAPLAVALLVVLGGLAVLVYQRFVHGT